MTEKEKRQLVAEVNILRELNHQNIVKYFERFVDKDKTIIHIIMEYCEGGDLANIIKRCKKEKKFIPEAVIWSFLSQLVLALNECHNGGSGTSSMSKPHPPILHRDIKPENVFLDKDQNVKLGDFGLSKIIESENEFAQTYVGTPFYMSPELINESCYNAKSDIWALGCLIFELCTLEPPFQSKTQLGLSAKIRQGKVENLPHQYSPELNRIIKSMLTVSHEKRPGTQDIMKVGKIRSYIIERELQQKMQELCLKEKELKRLEGSLKEKDLALKKREELIMAKEKFIVEKEKKFKVLMSQQQINEETKISFQNNFSSFSSKGNSMIGFSNGVLVDSNFKENF
ncbi:hypothetical protein HDU92_001262 [Lobulomyces angularis]|nr:hypothetical protein HDU92_001262 [Lobulomyces angularis]